MSSATLVTATDIAAWADRLEARAQLPQLIRRLVHATMDDPKKIGFRSGEGIQLGGWDGLVNVGQGNAFVPSGISGWEMGTNRDYRRKAREDFKKRKDNPLTNDPSNAAFVFVTPRRWDAPGRSLSKEGWAEKQRRATGHWKEVRVLDADDLESWLEQAPAVHWWFSQMLGKHPEGAIDGQGWWQDWSEVTDPPIRPDLLLAGRQAEAAHVVTWLNSSNPHLSIQADTSEEALAFFVSSLSQLPEPDCLDVLSRLLLVKDETAWQSLSASDAKLILVPLFDCRNDITRALRNGHRVLIPLDRSARAYDSTVKLSRMSRTASKKVLVRMGFSSDKAYELAGLARRSLMSFRRTLAKAPELQIPAWARPSEAIDLLPALLTGSWNDAKKGDRRIISELTQKPYEEAKTIFVRWANEEDPPVRNVGDNWYLVSKDDAWQLLSRFLTKEFFERFKDVIVEALCTPDPRFELPEEKQWMAAAYDAVNDFSGRICQGMSDTLAMMGALGKNITISNGITVRDHAQRIVRLVLGRANKDWRVWATISYYLQSMAEAAPQVLLDAIETGLQGDSPPVMEMFVQRGDDFLTGTSYHSGLLWALEVMAWSPKYLGRVALALARLAQLDPGGNMLNRPENSLYTIFLPWLPQTSADMDQRFQVIDNLRRREPEVAWRLLEALIPSRSSRLVTCNPKPRWRNWAPADSPSTTYREYHATVRGLIDRVLKDAGDDPSRWKLLVDKLGSMRGKEYTSVVEGLSALNARGLADKDKAPIWHALRELIAHHRLAPNAGWALPSNDVNALDELYQRFEPDDFVEKYGWLFDGWPDLPEGRGVKHRGRLVDRKRLAAIEDIQQNHGLAGLMHLASEIEPQQSYRLGFILGKQSLIEDNEPALFKKYLASDEKSLAAFAGGIASGAISERGHGWAQRTFSDLSETWTSQQQANFLEFMPFNNQTLDFVATTPQETQDVYWQTTNFLIVDDILAGTRIVQKLLEYNRPFRAIEILGFLQKKNSGFPAEFIADSLEKVLQTSETTDPPGQSIEYYLDRLLDAIENHPDVEERRVAAIEWQLLIQSRNRRQPKVLHRALANNPGFFVEVVSMQYRAKGQEPRDTTDQAKTRAESAFHLLTSWRTVPGQLEDGSIDLHHLSTWIEQAREKLTAAGRAEIGDQMIGQVLSGSPTDLDGSWPHRAVREIIEDVASVELERGFNLGVYNSRGVTTRGLGEGGAQERELAAKYNSYAEQVQDQYPRTAAMLRRIATHYSREAILEDQSAELHEDA